MNFSNLKKGRIAYHSWFPFCFAAFDCFLPFKENDSFLVMYDMKGTFEQNRGRGNQGKFKLYVLIEI